VDAVRRPPDLVRHRDLSGSLRPTSRGDNARLQQQATGTSQRGAVTWRGFGVVGAVSADAASVGGRPRRCHRRVTTSVTTTAPGPRPAPPAGSRSPRSAARPTAPPCLPPSHLARPPPATPARYHHHRADHQPTSHHRLSVPELRRPLPRPAVVPRLPHPLHPPRPRRPVPPLRRTRRDQRHPRTTSIAASRAVEGRLLRRLHPPAADEVRHRQGQEVALPGSEKLPAPPRRRELPHFYSGPTGPPTGRGRQDATRATRVIRAGERVDPGR
jgi:hypothetical protein